MWPVPNRIEGVRLLMLIHLLLAYVTWSVPVSSSALLSE
jgi:hypothetical protein